MCAESNTAAPPPHDREGGPTIFDAVAKALAEGVFFEDHLQDAVEALRAAVPFVAAALREDGMIDSQVSQQAAEKIAATLLGLSGSGRPDNA